MANADIVKRTVLVVVSMAVFAFFWIEYFEPTIRTHENLMSELQLELQRAREALIYERRHISGLFVDSLDNNGVLPLEMWQQNITIEQDTRSYATASGFSRQIVVIENEIHWVGLSDYGMISLSSFLRENFENVTLAQMLRFIEVGVIDIVGYI